MDFRRFIIWADTYAMPVSSLSALGVSQSDSSSWKVCGFLDMTPTIHQVSQNAIPVVSRAMRIVSP